MPSQDDMQFIPGVFCKPFSLILRCKSPQAMARLSVSQPLEQHGTQTGRQTHTDGKTENNASDCTKIEWEADYYLGKESWSTERGETVGEECALRRQIARDLEAGIWAGEEEDRQADRGQVSGMGPSSSTYN